MALKSLDIIYKSKADGLLEEKQILEAWVGKLETDSLTTKVKQEILVGLIT